MVRLLNSMHRICSYTFVYLLQCKSRTFWIPHCGAQRQNGVDTIDDEDVAIDCLIKCPWRQCRSMLWDRLCVCAWVCLVLTREEQPC